MIEQDTIRLLRECDAGIKMGISSIDEVLDNVHSSTFKQKLCEFRAEHTALQKQLTELLDKYHDDGKEPNVAARGMSWIKTNIKLLNDDSDKTIADLMTDGCNMGIKSLRKYLSQYEAADLASKSITKQLIDLEQRMLNESATYL